MTLVLIFVLVTAALFGLFWGGSLLAQGYLYNVPADRLPTRAAIAALLVGVFLTLWTAIDRAAPGRYDTFFEFAPYSTKEFAEFEAVRWQADPAALAKGKQEFRKSDRGEPVEQVSKVKRGPAGGFIDELTGKPFVLSGTFPPDNLPMMTAAILVKVDADKPPVRFIAGIKRDDRTGLTTYVGEPRFTEEKGSRYVEANQLGVVFVPSTWVIVAALTLNVLLFVVWMAAFWPVLHFSFGHALGFATVFGLVTMLLLMPLLFKPNRVPRPPVGAAIVTPLLAPRA